MDDDPLLHHQKIKNRTPIRAGRRHRGHGHWHVRIRTNVIVCGWPIGSRLWTLQRPKITGIDAQEGGELAIVAARRREQGVERERARLERAPRVAPCPHEELPSH